MLKRSFIFSCWPFLFAAAILFLLTGCGGNRPPVPEKPAFQGTAKIAIVGFRAALDEGELPHTVRDPLSGAVFRAEPVPPDVVRDMTRELFERLKARGGQEVLPPGQALGAYSSLASGDMKLALLPAKMLQEIGKMLGADLVLAGYLYRWTERRGTEYAVKRAASVAFSLQLVRVTDGRIIWKGKFDKTQRSLSENILDLKTFLGGGGRWMSARKLACLGLDRLLAEMP
ncbi:MAG: hypothetical protein JRI80_19810 [Deltaproteobacteria bacterium]|nr:hypothetical protein [Deltaproteobacteria bacterium]